MNSVINNEMLRSAKRYLKDLDLNSIRKSTAVADIDLIPLKGLCNETDA